MLWKRLFEGRLVHNPDLIAFHFLSHPCLEALRHCICFSNSPNDWLGLNQRQRGSPVKEKSALHEALDGVP